MKVSDSICASPVSKISDLTLFRPSLFVLQGSMLCQPKRKREEQGPQLQPNGHLCSRHTLHTRTEANFATLTVATLWQLGKEVGDLFSKNS